VLHALIREHSFGTLVSHDGPGLQASHLPFLLDPERGPHGTLVGHMARANPQWQSFRGEAQALVIFQGPHAYISPSWYAIELSVPTWNYVTVHAYGVPRLVEDTPALLEILQATVQIYEAPLPEPWSMERLPGEFVKKLTRAIVGFEVPIARLEGKSKLSQNRSQADQEGAIAGLIRQGEPADVAVAALMVGTGKPG
jgi:transcriptional regulator